jgi:hypothetical protein
MRTTRIMALAALIVGGGLAQRPAPSRGLSLLRLSRGACGVSDRRRSTTLPAWVA